MKNKYHFRISFGYDFDLDYPPMINIEFLSFHWEDHTKWITILGISFIWEKPLFETVRKK